jgi:predicted metal-dependent hydrolase
LLENYTLQRSRRKSINACFDANGILTVKAPLNMSQVKIDYFLEKHTTALWNLRQKTKHKIYLTSDIFQTEFKKFESINLLKQRFAHIQEQAKQFNLTTQKPPILKIMQSRWGSCSTKKQITLNLFLGLLPEHLIDAVIAHEFCHLCEMNHSQRFYKLLAQLYPNYTDCDAELKKYIIKK